MTSFRALQANLSILIIDACKSGTFLRPKGGDVINVPKIEKVDELSLTGTAILSSSSKNELAAESDELKGSLFTLHFVGALRGAADFNHDGVVTLWETFSYTKAGTEWEAASNRGLGQTPGYDFDMVGSADVGLSRVDRAGTRLVLQNLPAGKMDIYPVHGSEGRTRLWLRGGDTVKFSLPANKYMLALERDGKVAVYQADLSWKREQVVGPGQFKSFRPDQVRNKGSSLTIDPHRVTLTTRKGRFPFGNDLAMIGGRYSYSWYPFRIGIALDYGADEFFGEDLGQTIFKVNRNIWSLNGILSLPFNRIGPIYPSLEMGAGFSTVLQKIKDLRFGDPSQEGSVKVERTVLGGSIYHLILGMQVKIPLASRFSLSAGGWIQANCPLVDVIYILTPLPSSMSGVSA